MLFFQHSIFIDYLEIPHNAPWSHSLPSPLRTTLHPWDLSQFPQNEKYTKSNLCCLWTHQSMVKLPVASPLKITESLLTPSPHQKPSTVESYTSTSLPQFLRVFFNSFLSRLFLFGGVVGGRQRLSQKPSMSLVLNYESAVLDIAAKETSLLFTVNESTRHGLPHSIRWWHGPWTPTWPSAAAQTKDISGLQR